MTLSKQTLFFLLIGAYVLTLCSGGGWSKEKKYTEYNSSDNKFFKEDYIKQTSWDDDYGSGDESCDGYGEAMTYGNSCNEACGTNPEDCKQIATTYSCWCIDGLKYINQECVNGTNCSCTDSNARSVLGNPCYDDCNMVEEVCDLEELYWYCNCIEDYYKINNTCQPAANCPS